MARQTGAPPLTYGPRTTVRCDGCSRHDLVEPCGHFFHCPPCRYDLCPACAEPRLQRRDDKDKDGDEDKGKDGDLAKIEARLLKGCAASPRWQPRQDTQLCKLVTAAIRTHQPIKGSTRCLRCNSRLEPIGAVRQSPCGLCDTRGQHTLGTINQCPRCTFDVCQSCSEEGTRTKPFSIDKLSADELIEAAAKLVPGNPLYSELQETRGLAWRDVGSTPPPCGREICNEALSDALRAVHMRGNARAFTQEELMQFGVADLAPDHYVQVGGRYYQPEEGTPLEALAERYLILKGLSDGVFKRLLPWVNLNEADIPHSVAHEVSSLRARLFWERKEPFFRDALKATRTDVRRELLKTFNLNRRKAIEAREQAEAGKETPAGEQQPPLTIFQQIGAQLFKEATTPAERLWALVELNRTHRTNEGGSRSASTSLAFSVRFEGELGQDEGGPFRETLETFAAELTAPPLQLLVPVPNGRKDVNGQYEEKGGDVWGRDRYMLNPAVPSAERLRDFELMGAFMGVAIRSEVPLPLVLASTLLKGLVGEPTTLDDYELCDKAKTDLIRRVREALPSLEIGASPLDAELFDDIYSDQFNFALLTSELRAHYHELRPGGRHTPLTYPCRHEWADLAEEFVLHECDAQLAAVRRGLSAILPLGVMSVLTGAEFERLLTGDGDWKVSDLKKNARVEEAHKPEHAKAVAHLWEMLDEMSVEEKALFCRFARGSSRMPPGCKGIMLILRPNSDGPEYLPVAHTCFFLIDLPPYTSKEMCREKFLIAMHNCVTQELV